MRCPQIATEGIDLTRPIAAPAVPQSAPSPSSPGLARECIGLFPWAEGGGVRGGSWWLGTLLLVVVRIAVSVSTDCHKLYHPASLPPPPMWSDPLPRRLPLVYPGGALACSLGPGGGVRCL